MSSGTINENARRKTLDGRRVTYLEFDNGAASTVVFLHASATGADASMRFARALAGRHRVLAPNLPGYGGTDASDSPIVTAVADICALIESEGLDRVALVGHSMGGFVALKAGLALGGRAGRVVAIEPMAFGALDPEADMAELYEDGGTALALEAAMARGEPEAGLRAFLGLWNETPWDELPEAIRNRLLALAPQIRRDVAAVSPDRAPAADYVPLADRLALFAGELSPAPARRIVERLHAAVPGSSSAVLPGLGHMGPLVRPDSVAAPVLEVIEMQKATP